MTSFNPSVGMAGVQASAAGSARTGCSQFQSLSRDGGGSSSPAGRVVDRQGEVSIPQSGWRGFKPLIFTPRHSVYWGFQSLSRDGGGSSIQHAAPGHNRSSFNPSVGMAGVQAVIGPGALVFNPKFQSLSRDGGGSSQNAQHSPGCCWSFNPSVGMAGVQAACPSAKGK